ncbi:MAG: hypothetical protein M1492_09470, partial [Gammaproteobacteria bacterium]|nr:hypothetical protein [Gammaproteobacteria bacterium]
MSHGPVGSGHDIRMPGLGPSGDDGYGDWSAGPVHPSLYALWASGAGSIEMLVGSGAGAIG